MQLKGDQLVAHLERGLAPVYVVHGDEPLLVLEAADTIRQKARQSGFDEREVLTALTGFDWSALAEVGCNLSLFGGRKVIDLRIPTGKPGRDGGAALQSYCQHLSPDNLLLVTLPALDWKDEKAAWLTALGAAGVVVKLQAPPLAELPGWIAGRLRRQHQKADRDALMFMAERVEGNLLAAHQEIQKLALLYPQGELSFEQIRDAVLNVARYHLDDLREAILTGDLPRYARTLQGLRQEGEALPLVLWAVSEETRAMLSVREAMDQGKPIDAVMKLAKIWGPRQVAIRHAVSRLRAETLRSALKTLFDADKSAKGVGGVARPDPWEVLLRMGFELCAGRTR